MRSLRRRVGVAFAQTSVAIGALDSIRSVATLARKLPVILAGLVLFGGMESCLVQVELQKPGRGTSLSHFKGRFVLCGVFKALQRKDP